MQLVPPYMYMRKHQFMNNYIHMNLKQRQHHVKEILFRAIVGWGCAIVAVNYLFGYHKETNKMHYDDMPNYENEAEMRYSDEFKKLLVHKKRDYLPKKVRDFDDPLIWTQEKKN